MTFTRCLLIVLAVVAGSARADPGYYVVTPYDNQGVRFVDFRYWTVKADRRGEMIWPELGLGLGINSRWTSELFMSWIGPPQRATRPSSLNWQNDVLLTQGELPLDIALHLQLVNDRDTPSHDTLEFGPVLQTDIGRTQINANLLLDRNFDPPAPQPTQLKYQWQLRHRWRRGLHFGLQGFGELGRWDDWAPHGAQSHRAGPALFTTWRMTDGTTAKLQAAWLEGKTYGRRGHMFTLQAKLEF